MTDTTIHQLFLDHWRDGVEIAILTVALYYGWLYFRGTRGAKVLTGFAMLFLALALVAELLRLDVLAWILRSASAILAIAFVVIFQPELRRAFAALGSHHLFATASQSKETVELLTEAVFDLSNRQFGALIALERDTSLSSFAESGVTIDCDISPEMIITMFFPKTPLHDGGLVVSDDRIVAAACIFPLSQREDLERDLGLRHRAGLGITEESDAIAIVVSEETGLVSICHQGEIERNFTPEKFKRRLNQLLLLEKYEKTPAKKLDGEDRLLPARNNPLVSHQKER